MFKLSARLQIIYDQMTHGMPVWDTCCDHGKIGFNAHESGNFSEVHLVDQVPEIMERLKKNSEKYRVENNLNSDDLYFHGQSAGDLASEIKGNFVIAGVGAHTVQEILTPLFLKKSFQPNRIIVSAHNKEDMVLDWLKVELAKKSYELIKTITVSENSRLRMVWVFQFN